ncbi:MAG: hypothetical protein ACYC67_10400 [Prosthecobacter sp.]
MRTATITPDQKQGRIALLHRMKHFFGNKEMAVTAAKRGDRESARFWGAMARYDWSLLSALLANPAL